MLRTRVGYAGGTKLEPTYHDLGDHSESFQIDFDPTQISFRELAKIYFEQFHPDRSWSRQYMCWVFHHDEAQKALALELGGPTAEKAIVPYTRFWAAEDYHQKYYLRNTADLFRELKGYDDAMLMSSTIAARLNGFAGGHGTEALLQEELPSYGLSKAGENALKRLARR